MNKDELIREAAKKAGVPYIDAADVLNLLIEIIQAEVAEGEKVFLLNFGSFYARKREFKRVVNNFTKERFDVPEKYIPVFTASKKFKDMCNEKV